MGTNGDWTTGVGRGRGRGRKGEREGGPTWWCRDKDDAGLRREIDKVRSLQFRRIGLGREHHADGVSGPAEALAYARAVIGASVAMRRDVMDVRDVASVRHAELYEGIRNLAG